MLGSSTGNEKGSGTFLKRMYHQLDIHVSSSKFPLVLFVWRSDSWLLFALWSDKLIRESEK